VVWDSLESTRRRSRLWPVIEKREIAFLQRRMRLKMVSASPRGPFGIPAALLGLERRRNRLTLGCALANMMLQVDRARTFSVSKDQLSLMRNFGISAHIDSGKTTLTERVLFYTGRVDSIHEVRGKDGVGAKMDSMELEREKGITIQSAATYTTWKPQWADTPSHMNLVDTPGHIDFGIEVERALRVLDGAVMVVCAVGGVQSQTYTVSKQMYRNEVPRIVFINKLDRQGSNPDKVVQAIRDKLKLNAAAVQIPIGLEDKHEGVVDIIRQKAIYFKGDFGEVVEEGPVPEKLQSLVDEKRMVLLERLGEVDDEIAELFLMEESADEATLKKAIRKQVKRHAFTPVLMGSAFKNKGVQPLLDSVVDYLPSPSEMEYSYLDLNENEKEKALKCDPDAPLVALAFKLQESKFGQLTYLRIYQGSLKRGMLIRNTASNKKVKIPRVVRMHSDEMEDVDEVGPGEIAALFGVECNSGDTFCAAEEKGFNPTMMTMFVPDPVVSLAIAPKTRGETSTQLSKALNRFQREDPTFRVHTDQESKDLVISGMGELHLDVYIERIRREYKVDLEVGFPKVNYRETITRRVDFSYLHKKQSGGSGQFGRVMGYIEPMSEEEKEKHGSFLFENAIIGNAIPPEYIAAVESGFKEAMGKGSLIGHPLSGIKVVLQDGQAHSVDSSEMAFRAAGRGALRSVYFEARPQALEPVMKVDISVPEEYQGTVVGGVNKRRGLILDTSSDGATTSIVAEVPLKEMFGYANDIRSSTQAKGEFSMEFKAHQPMPQNEMEKLVQEYKTELQAASG